MKRIGIKTVYAVLIILFLIVVGLFFLLNNKKSKTGPGLIAPQQAAFPSYYEGKFKITLNPNIIIDVPEKLPLYQYSVNPISENFAANIATNLGFIVEPKKSTTKSNETILFWMENGNVLKISTSQGSIFYNSSKVSLSKKPTSTEILSDDDIKIIALNYIENIDPQLKNKYQPYSVEYYTVQETNYQKIRVDSKELATVYQINLVPKGFGYEIGTFFQNSPKYLATLNSDGKVVGFGIENITDVKEINNVILLHDKQEIINHIDAAKVVEIDGVYVMSESLESNDIESVEITNIRIVYLQEEGINNSYIPAFRLDGISTIKSLNKKIPTLLYMQAVKK